MVEQFPSPAELSERFAGELATAELRFSSAVSNVDARVAFGGYALSRLATPDSSLQYARPTPAGVEHAAWLLYPEFDKSSARDGGRIQEVIDAIEAHGAALNFTEMFPAREDTDPKDHLASHLRLHSGIVRGSAYPLQLIRRIEKVLRPFEAEFAARVGVGPWRAVEILKALGTATEVKIHSGHDKFAAIVARHEELARKKRRADEEAELLDIRSKVDELAGRLAVDWVPSKDEVGGVVRALSDREWASLRDLIGLTPASRLALSTIVEVQDRPLFFLDPTHAFYVHGGQCFDAVFNAFDGIARNDVALRDRHGDRVARWMEEETSGYMKRLFPPANIFRNA